MPKLTKSFIDKYPAPISKDKFEWDTELKGFGIRVALLHKYVSIWFK